MPGFFKGPQRAGLPQIDPWAPQHASLSLSSSHPPLFPTPLSLGSPSSDVQGCPFLGHKVRERQRLTLGLTLAPPGGLPESPQGPPEPWGSEGREWTLPWGLRWISRWGDLDLINWSPGNAGGV